MRFQDDKLSNGLWHFASVAFKCLKLAEQMRRSIKCVRKLLPHSGGEDYDCI